MSKRFYMEKIAKAQSIDELEIIIDDAAQYMENNREYEEVYSAALQKIQGYDWN